MSEFSSNDLRRAFGAFPTGVTVVTTRTADGGNVGFTANSFTSVSMSPPLVLVCLDRRATVHSAFAVASGFAVNILAHDQKEIATRFASRVPDRFEGVRWEEGATGLPLLHGHVAFFECELEQVVAAGDHTIFIGRIVAMDVKDLPPLGFHRGAFSEPSASRGV
ncbi:flavin reductase family protein [Duganella sp. PWIR1]